MRDELDAVKRNIRLFNRFKYTFYLCKARRRLRYWLYTQVIETYVKTKYHPIYLIYLLHDADDASEIEIENKLNEWCK
jgi:hypothetical protein